MSTNPTSQRPAYIEEIRAGARGVPFRPAKRAKRAQLEPPGLEDYHRLFTVATGNRWMDLAQREPGAKMLFGELWHEGELCMLFAESNVGKSVMAVQIGESIARQRAVGPFTCQAPPARVLYIDFELSAAQFGMRYTDAGDDYIFSDNFFRAQYNFINDAPANVDENELLIAAIEYKIKLVQATVVIIDNITCLRGGTENATVALSLMKNLKALKNDHKLSILVLAHTPKRRKATQPITADDLHGSKLLINFADSAFAISKSNADKDLCYLKQIKQRNTRQRYGDDNVCRCRIHKPGNFLHFKFEGNSPEHDHLVSAPVATRQQLTDKIAALAAGGVTQRDISEALNIPLASVNRLMNGNKKRADVLDVDEYLAAYSPEGKPEFVKPNTFEIIIPIDNGSLNGDAVVNDSINDTASNTINEAAEEPADDGVKERLLSIVRTIHKNPGVRPDIIANAPGIDVRSIRRDIKMLVEAGIILFKGTRKTGGYFIGEEYEGRFKE